MSVRVRSIPLILVVALIGLPVVPQAQEQCTAIYGNGPDQFILATGSPGELGVIKALAEVFTAQTNTRLCWKKAGSGESLKLLKDKAVDMAMSHSPAVEKQALAEGWATHRTLFGSNEFFIVGPADDPAKVAEATGAEDAYRRIATAKAKFFSRGDNSGTHQKEMQLWTKAGIAPSGDWYLVTHAFMIATLKRANDEQGYFMTDSSTWVAEKNNMPRLKVLFRGDKALVNVYHALGQPDGATAGAASAARFIQFVTSEAAQKILRDFGKDKFGEGLYNDAEYARQFDD
jgi:tungstate transport system substrate-binding protein